MTTSRIRFPLAVVAPACRFSCLLVVICLLLARSLPAQSPSSLLVVQSPAGMRSDTTMAPGIFPVGSRARIIRVNPDGSTRVLTEGFESACDPDVSFDGKRILFAGRKNPAEPWNIYEMNADGSGLRRVTQGLGDCRSPVYLSTLYTIVSDKPWYTIAFVSDGTGVSDAPRAAGIYSCKLDGSAARRLTFNPFGDTTPFQMTDGRLIFAGLRCDAGGLRTSIFGINIDGTDYAAFTGDQGGRFLHSPCTTTAGLAVFVESDEISPDGGGHLAGVLLRRNLHSYRRITAPGDGIYLTPSPLPEGGILVSRRPESSAGSYAVCRLDPSSGRAEQLFDDPAFDDIQAKVLAPRPEPDGRSSVVDEREAAGKLYCLDVYTNDLADPARLPRGTVKRVRAVEGVPRFSGGPGRPPDGLCLSAHEGSYAVPVGRRILGEAPVESDGSFNLEVPADIPIQLQILDSNGMALRTCSWIWVKGRESRGCIGCHEDGELAPVNELRQAVVRPSVALTLPPGKRRTIDFLRDVMPIISEKCASSSCHGGGIPPVIGVPAASGRGSAGESSFKKVYDTLLSGNFPAGRASPGRYVDPGRARTSPLIRLLFGEVTSRPWDHEAASTKIDPLPAHPQAGLSEIEKRILIEWIDLGACWTGLPEATKRHGLPGEQGVR